MNKKKIESGTYKVQKGIPMPGGKRNYARFPLEHMLIGDSFYVPKQDQDPVRLVASIHSAVNSYNRTHGTFLKVATRQDEGGVRVWRIEDIKHNKK